MMGTFSPWTVDHSLLEIAASSLILLQSPHWIVLLLFLASLRSSHGSTCLHMAPFIQTRATVPNIKQPVCVAQALQKDALEQTLEAPCRKWH